MTLRRKFLNHSVRHCPVPLGLAILGLIGLGAPHASAAPIRSSSHSSGLMGDIRHLGNWFQQQQNHLNSALDFNGVKTAFPGHSPGQPSTVGQLENSVGSLTPAQMHHLALAAVKQDPSLTPIDGLIPHTPRVVALEKQRDLNPTTFDTQHPSLGRILASDEALRTPIIPLTVRAMSDPTANVEVASAPAAELVSAPAVVPEPGGALVALMLLGAGGLMLRRRRA